MRTAPVFPWSSGRDAASIREGDRGTLRFSYRDTYYAYQSGFDPRRADDSPGEVMLGMVIEDMIDRGVREFNFLRGAQPRRLRRRFPGWSGMPPASVPAATSVLT